MSNPGPYARAARMYLDAGWSDVLRMPPVAKDPPPTGYTGARAITPDTDTIEKWIKQDGNIAIHLPEGIVGIDVDNYGKKKGLATITAHAERFGPLPPTWRVSARPDGISGIRLFKVPPGLLWPGDIGNGVEIVQFRHRYCMAWPSIHPETMTPYEWRDETGAVRTDAVPRRDAVADLPQSWVDGLTNGEAHTVEHASLAAEDVAQWVAEHGGPACAEMSAALEHALNTMNEAAAHDQSMVAVLRMVGMAAEGHAGLEEALDTLGAAFTEEVQGRRPAGAAEREWGRLVHGAVERVLAGPIRDGEDPCEDWTQGLAPAAPWIETSTRAPDLGTVRPAPFIEPPSPTRVLDEDEHTSWWPVDLESALTGEEQKGDRPTWLTRDDGVELFYPGKVNGLIGESESGKSWIAQYACVQMINAGQTVLYIDMEDDVRSVVERFTLQGCTPEQIRKHLRYVQPDEAPLGVAAEELSAMLDVLSPSGIVLDGVNAAMVMFGMDPDSTPDATLFHQGFLRTLTGNGEGAGVVLIDHVAKNPESRGKGAFGAQGKRAMMTGTQILVTVEQEFGRGRVGRIKLTVDKDRKGYVRGHAGSAKHVGTAVIDSAADGGKVRMCIEPPTALDEVSDTERAHDANLRAVWLYAEAHPEITRTRLVDGVLAAGLQVESKKEAGQLVIWLVDNSYLIEEPGPRNGTTYRTGLEFSDQFAELV